MLGDAGHGVGMEHLNEQRSEPADQHGRQVAVNNARHAVEGEVRLVGIVTARWWFLGQSDGIADIAIDASSQPCQGFTGHRG